jgi:uncharacterized membrane protein
VSAVTIVMVVLALLGSGLMAGVFFAFSSFIMKALGRLPAEQGIGAMQAINVVVINPVFLGVFMGTAVLSVLIGLLAVPQWGSPAAVLYLGAGVSYLVGTFLTTVVGNVPLNERLADCPAASPESVAMWEHYLERWTTWNHVRTLAAALAVVLFASALMSAGA